MSVSRRKKFYRIDKYFVYPTFLLFIYLFFNNELLKLVNRVYNGCLFANAFSAVVYCCI